MFSLTYLTLFHFLKKTFPSIVLEHIIYKRNGNPMFLDMAIVEDKLNFEYDSIYYHKNKENEDKIRDNYLTELGWTVIRIKENELQNFIKAV